MKRFWDKVDKSGDCWEWTAGKVRDGYGVFQVNGKAIRAHRMAWILENGEIPSGDTPRGTMLVCHACDNPPCVNPDHLFLGTPLDNTRDMIRKGRQNILRGQDHKSSILCDVDVLLIRDLDLPIQSIADWFDMSYNTIWHIKKRKLWKHLPMEERDRSANNED